MVARDAPTACVDMQSIPRPRPDRHTGRLLWGHAGRVPASLHSVWRFAFLTVAHAGRRAPRAGRSGSSAARSHRRSLIWVILLDRRRRACSSPARTARPRRRVRSVRRSTGRSPVMRSIGRTPRRDSSSRTGVVPRRGPADPRARHRAVRGRRRPRAGPSRQSSVRTGRSGGRCGHATAGCRRSIRSIVSRATPSVSATG